MIEKAIGEKARCPACRAVQDWSEQCRRCKCDLTLVWRAALDWQRSRSLALDALWEGRPFEALDYARRAQAIANDAESARLVAVASLAAGDFAGAVHWARNAGP